VITFDMLYRDINSHYEAGDRIAAIAINRHMLYYLNQQTTYEMARMVRPEGFQILGYPVALIDEIPDGEWIIVCEDRRTRYVDWDLGRLSYGQALQLQKKLVIDS
jgi:hypothetical protein